MSPGSFYSPGTGWHLHLRARLKIDAVKPGTSAELVLELASLTTRGGGWVGAANPMLEIPKDPQV